MGLWSFLTGSGKAAAATSGDGSPTADALKAEVEGIGVDTSEIDIQIENGDVKLSGGALSDEEREKVILAVGNVEGDDHRRG